MNNFVIFIVIIKYSTLYILWRWRHNTPIDVVTNYGTRPYFMSYTHRKIALCRKNTFLRQKTNIFWRKNNFFFAAKKRIIFWCKWNIFLRQRKKTGYPFLPQKNILFARKNHSFFAAKKFIFAPKNSRFLSQKRIFSTQCDFSMSVESII